MLGPKGIAFDNDEILDDNDDEDLRNDPVSQMDMQVGVVYIGNLHLLNAIFKAHLMSFLRECAAHNTNNFSAIVDQLSPEEMFVIRRIVNVNS